MDQDLFSRTPGNNVSNARVVGGDSLCESSLGYSNSFADTSLSREVCSWKASADFVDEPMEGWWAHAAEPRFEASKLAPGVDRLPDLSHPHPVSSGSYASVWRAGKRGEYAIKSFHGKAGNACKEYHVLVRLKQAGCTHVPEVLCLGAFVDGEGVPHDAIVERYVAGKSLASVLEGGYIPGDGRTHVIETWQAAAIATEMAKALKALASAGVAHRDLSPRNVMLTDDCVRNGLRGGIGLRLVDFGQSVLLYGTLTLEPSLATIPYAAPEAFEAGCHGWHGSEKCDIWSIGALICAMVVGEYWPGEIADLRGRMLWADDLCRISMAKRHPVDLVGLLGDAGVEVGPSERRLAEVVAACTSYEPDLRPSPDGLVKVLSELARPSTRP